MPSPGILLVDRGNHAFTSQHHLILGAAGNVVLRIIKGQRPEEHLVGQRSLHEFTVQIGKQGITNRQHPAHILCPAEAVNFLITGVLSGMVAHQGGKDPQLQPAKQQILRGVLPEAAQIRPVEEEAAHVQGGKLLQVQQNVTPPGAVISLPNTAVPMGAYVG